MFSLSKILFTLALIVAVLAIYKTISVRSRVAEQRRTRVGERRREEPLELEQCPACGAFVELRSHVCDRAGHARRA